MPIYSTRVIARNSFGRFIQECEQAAQNTVQDTVIKGATIAAANAPKRTGALAASIKPVMLSRTSGLWGSNLKYAAPQETGSRPHDLPANVSFFWEREGRMWMTPDAYLRTTGFPGADPIHHPGNPATHYMKISGDAMRRRMAVIAASKYPG